MKKWFTEKLHPSWFVGWGCLGVLIGTALCAIISPYVFKDNFWLIIAISLALISFTNRSRYLILLIWLAGSLIGLQKGSNLKAELVTYRSYYGNEVQLSGRVSQDAAIGEKGDQRLNLKSIVINDQSLKGTVWISTNKADIKRGDLVTLKGKLNEGFGNLSASMYRAEVTEVIRPNPGDVARRVRDWFGQGVRKAIPEPQVSLGLGYLVGQKTALPPDLEDQIKITGLTHVVVASGYNLTILVIFSRKLFASISKYFAALASFLMVMSFMLVTGLSPSMSRAGLVASLGLLVWYYGRKMHPFILLSFAAAVTVLVDPSYVWGDLGWYLSFTAFIGVIVLAPLLQRYFWGSQDNVPTMRQLLVDTSSAQILTTPIIFMSFGQLAVYALPANLLVLPLVPLAMLCTFIAGIAGLIVPSLAYIFAFPATAILTYSTEVIAKVASLPNAQSELTFNPPLMIVSYIGIAIAIIYLKRRTKYDFRSETEPETY